MFAKQFEAMEQRLKMLEEAAKSDLDVKTLTAERMEKYLNGDGAGDLRTVEYAKKGDVFDYLAMLANEELDREALASEYAKWKRQQATENAEREAQEQKRRADRDEELEDYRKKHEE